MLHVPQIGVDIPVREHEHAEEPSSPLSASTQLSGSPIALDPSTMAILDSFLSEKAEEERRFRELAAHQEEDHPASVDRDTDADGANTKADARPMSVEQYTQVFSENFGLSQFWYTPAFAYTLARALSALSFQRIAFLCCPTGFVAYRHLYPRQREALLLEYDDRFKVLAREKFVQYDLNEPERVPSWLEGSVDVAVVDPPYLKNVTNERIARTLSRILNPRTGCLVLITSTTVPALADIYAAVPPLGPLRKVKLDVEHNGLRNDFAVWASFAECEGWETREDA